MPALFVSAPKQVFFNGFELDQVQNLVGTFFRHGVVLASVCLGLRKRMDPGFKPGVAETRQAPGRDQARIVIENARLQTPLMNRLPFFLVEPATDGPVHHFPVDGLGDVVVHAGVHTPFAVAAHCVGCHCNHGQVLELQNVAD